MMTGGCTTTNDSSYKSPRRKWSCTNDDSTYQRYARTRRKWTLLSFSLAVTVLCGGLVYGFPALRYHLLEEEGSRLSETQFGLIYTIGSGGQLCTGFIIGLCRDRLGTRTAVQISIGSAASGALLLAFCGPHDVWQLCLALVLIEVGSGAQICCFPVAELFNANPGTVVGLLTGAFNVSTVLFPVLFAVSSDRRIVVGGYGILVGVLAAVGSFLLPKGLSFQHELSEEENNNGASPQQKVSPLRRFSSTQLSCDDSDDDLECNKTVTTTSSFTNTNNYDSDNNCDEDITTTEENIDGEDDDDSNGNQIEEGTKTPSTTLQQQIKSLEYLGLLGWFAISVLPLQYYAGSIGFQLEHKGDVHGKYISLFSALFAASPVVAPLGGFLSDRFGLGLVQGIATLLNSIAFGLLLVDSLEIQIAGMICYSFGRMMVFAMFYSNIGIRFGYDHLGTLVGVGGVASALLSLAQYPMFYAASAQGFSNTVNLVSAVVFLGLLPYCIWLGRKEATERKAVILLDNNQEFKLSPSI